MPSDLERLFAFHIKASKLPRPETEFRFHPTRKFRFDFAWPEHMVAVEVEGGVWSTGRHTRGKGFTNDCCKYNIATLLGWKVLRFTGDLVKSGQAVQETEALLNQVRKQQPA